jgi:hypothetical protein
LFYENEEKQRQERFSRLETLNNNRTETLKYEEEDRWDSIKVTSSCIKIVIKCSCMVLNLIQEVASYGTFYLSYSYYVMAIVIGTTNKIFDVLMRRGFLLV